jgi:hypothetical protein
MEDGMNSDWIVSRQHEWTCHNGHPSSTHKLAKTCRPAQNSGSTINQFSQPFPCHTKTDHTQCRDFPIKPINYPVTLQSSLTPSTTFITRVESSPVKINHHEFLRQQPILTPLHHWHLPNHQIQTYYIPTRTILIHLILLTQRRLIFLLQTTTPRWLYPEPHPQTQALDTRAVGVCATTPFQGFYGCGGAVGECGGCCA